MTRQPHGTQRCDGVALAAAAAAVREAHALQGIRAGHCATTCGSASGPAAQAQCSTPACAPSPRVLPSRVTHAGLTAGAHRNMDMGRHRASASRRVGSSERLTAGALERQHLVLYVKCGMLRECAPPLPSQRNWHCAAWLHACALLAQHRTRLDYSQERRALAACDQCGSRWQREERLGHGVAAGVGGGRRTR